MEEKRQKVAAGRRQPTFIQGHVFLLFQRRCHDAPRFLDRTMFIFWYRCGVVVLYSTLFLLNFLHFRHVSISNDLHRPWECLIQCILPEWVLRNFDRKDEMVWKWKEAWCEVFFSEVFQVTRWVDLLISKEATSQNKAFCTAPQWNSYLFLLSLFCFLFLFYSSIFFGMVLSLNTVPRYHSKYWQQSKVSAHPDL